MYNVGCLTAWERRTASRLGRAWPTGFVGHEAINFLAMGGCRIVQNVDVELASEPGATSCMRAV